MVPIFLIILPLLEIAGFIVVGQEIGILATIALIIFTTILGGVLLRIQGISNMARMRQTAEAGGMPGREVVHGFMIFAAGILLVLPGFITDIIGLLLFIPPIRDLAWNALRRRIVVLGPDMDPTMRRPYPEHDNVIDLDVDDYTSRKSKDTPWRQLDDD